MREAPIPRYKADATGPLVPDLHAAAAIIYNPETKQVLWEENSQDKRSIASITKVMTAVVFVESDPDMSQVVTVERTRHVYAASTTHLRPNYQVSVHDLLHLAADLVGQRRGPRAGPRLAVGAGRLRRADEREGERTRPAEHDLRGPVRPRRGQRLVGLRHGAADRLRVGRRDASPRSCGSASYTLTLGRRPVTIHSTNRLLHAQRSRGQRARRRRPGSSAESGYCLATLLKLPQRQPAGGGGRARRAFERRPLHRGAATSSAGCPEGARRSSGKQEEPR